MQVLSALILSWHFFPRIIVSLRSGFEATLQHNLKHAAHYSKFHTFCEKRRLASSQSMLCIHLACGYFIDGNLSKEAQSTKPSWKGLVFQAVICS